jgi:hypothetical protein
VEIKYDSMKGGWCSKEIVGAFGVGLQKNIRRERGFFFYRFVRYELGGGSKIRF